MNYYNRFIEGEYKEVHNEILNLGETAFNNENLIEVEKVYEETFNRVKFNINCIYQELEKINYLFYPQVIENWKNKNEEFHDERKKQIGILQEGIKKYGFIPLSLKYFYKIIGEVNFCWNFKLDERILWWESDPFQLESISERIEEVFDENWEEFYTMQMKYFKIETGYVDISEDYLQKNGMSGGHGYSIKLSENPSTDEKMINIGFETTFINYLRVIFNNCGFLGNGIYKEEESWKNYYKMTKPKMKKF